MNFTMNYKWANIVLGALVMVLLAALGWLWLKNESLTNEMAHSKQELKQQIQEEKSLNVNKVATAVHTKSRNVNKFKNWKRSVKAADVFYKKSGGKFKKNWGQYLALQAYKRDINPSIVYQLLSVETGGSFHTDTVGPPTKYGRAYGMAQFMSNTAPWIAKMAGVEYKKENLFDPYYSILLSVTYLDYLHGKYHNWNKALTAYNRGVGGLQSYIAEKGNAKSPYAVSILNTSG